MTSRDARIQEKSRIMLILQDKSDLTHSKLADQLGI